MATWSERWAEDARSCPSMPAEGGCRGLAQVGTASGSAAKAWKLPRRGRATLRGKPRRARGVPRAAAPTLFASEGGVSRCKRRDSAATVLSPAHTSVCDYPFFRTGSTPPVIHFFLF